MVSTSQKILAIAAHISYLLFGVGYILVPLIIVLVRKDEDDFTTEHAKQALCVQVIAALLGVIVGGLMFLLVGFLLIPVLFALGAVWFICSFIGAWRALNGEYYEYPLIGSIVDRLS